jgi:uncharacterized protein (DUF1499 family)
VVSLKPRRHLKALLKLSPLLLVAFFAVLGGVSMMSGPPGNLGVDNGRLPDCPATPNCVSTQTESNRHRMMPIAFQGSGKDAFERLKLAISRSFTRVKLTEEKNNYLRYEFSSLLFRFVDDVEFLLDNEKQLIHFRSASRVGYSDLGANRRRMTKITEEFNR